MSAKSWKKYQEQQKTIAYFEKEYGAKGFYEVVRRLSKLRAQGVDVEAALDRAEGQPV
jgi:hypothetical protein